MNLMKLALEDNKSVENKETEIVIYSKIGDVSGLNQASSFEEHVQLETNELKSTTGNSFRFRVRKVTKDNDTKYYLTFKTKDGIDEIESVQANKEYTTEIDENYFLGFKSIANKELVKTRFIFSSTNVLLSVKEQGVNKELSIPNIQYEVDVYTKQDGSKSEWCKIDVEVDNILDHISNEINDMDTKQLKINIKLSYLPFKPHSSIIGSSASEEQQKVINEIWENEFNRKIE